MASICENHLNRIRSFLLIAIVPSLYATDSIRLNQIGFYPNSPKIAAVKDIEGSPFFLVDPEGDTLYSGGLTGTRYWEHSGENVSLADFSTFTIPGEYRLCVSGLGCSSVFTIEPHEMTEAAKASLKTFYYQRASMDLTPQYAGKWARPLGHPDTSVIIHPSAASENRPAGTRISSPKGWYDAGDYNKYIVNSGITLYTLLLLYEQFPAMMDTINLNIPESGNELPDLLDEALWNLRWMLTMQDPEDGGVYHKCTTPQFEGMVMPHVCGQDRYLVQKSTAAALDFAAVMAQASRVFSLFESELPGLADSCLSAAKSAWAWAEIHPDVIYNQDKINGLFDPDIWTGAYGGGDLSDEKFWAAMELAVTTQNPEYLSGASAQSNGRRIFPQSWGDVRPLGYYTFFRHQKDLRFDLDSDLESPFLLFADSLLAKQSESAYDVVMGESLVNFIWGSNAIAANQSMALFQAYLLTGKTKYRDAALSNIDYLLGRNPTAYSFLTGFGHKTPMHLHHRPSEADGIDEPIPGFLAGGPNMQRQDEQYGVKYPSSFPALCYVDTMPSYATNEIAINFNAALVYDLFAAEALFESER